MLGLLRFLGHQDTQAIVAHLIVGRTDLRIWQVVLTAYIVVLLEQREHVLHVEGH